MMKFYQSPLLIATILLVGYGIYLILDWGRDSMGWSYLAGIVVLISGLVICFFHFAIKVFLKNKRYHFIAELLILLSLFIWLFIIS